MTTAIPVTIKTCDPIILSAAAADSLTNETLSWIPGTTVLGALAGAGQYTPGDADFNTVFCGNSVRFLDAYPVINKQRTLPRPLCLATLKEIAKEKTTWWNRATGQTEKPIERCKPGLILSSNPRRDYAATPETRDHVAIKADSSRTAKDGALYAYEAIPAGTVFQTWILADDSGMATELASRLANVNRIRLGRSRCGGYGRADLVVGEPVSATNDLEYASQPTTTHTVTLLSDYCPHAGMSPMQSITQDLASHGVTVDDCWIETRCVQGFRGVWGLPRPTVEVITRGSVLKVSGDLSAMAHADGIGQRRNEGCGRIALDWVAHDLDSWEKAANTTHEQKCDPLDRYPVAPTNTDSVLKAMKYRRRAAKVIEIAAEIVASPFGRELTRKMAAAASPHQRHQLSMSQWKRLHSVMCMPASRMNHKLTHIWFFGKPGKNKINEGGVLQKSNSEAWKRNYLPLPTDNSKQQPASELLALLMKNGWESGAAAIAKEVGKTLDGWTSADCHQLITAFLHLQIRAAKAAMVGENKS